MKWLLRQAGNAARVEQIPLTATKEHCFAEFPDPALEPEFDAPDRRFAAIAHAHPDQPPIWQAADCKWLDWWPALQIRGLAVDFLCSTDACRFYSKKFPGKPLPALPAKT